MRRSLALAALSLVSVAASAQAPSDTGASATRRTRLAIEAVQSGTTVQHLAMERAITRHVSLALGGRPHSSMWANSPAITALDASARLYPGGRALAGLYLGARVGYERIARPPHLMAPDGSQVEGPDHFRTDFAGVMAGYNLYLYRGLTLSTGYTADRLRHVGYPIYGLGQGRSTRNGMSLGIGWSF